MALITRSAFLLFLALAVVVPLRTWFFEPITIASASMEPTLKVGTLLILDKWTLGGRAPRRGEIVSFDDLVKRVIAVPGDEVQLKDKKVWVNGSPLDEPYAVYRRPGERLKGDNLGPWTVPQGCYFVLGDNRDESNDSSVWTDPCLKRERLQGLVRRLPWA